MKEFEDKDEDLFGEQSLEARLNKDLVDEEESTEEDQIDSTERLGEAKTALDNDQEEVAKKHGHLSKDDYLKKHGSLDGYKTPEEFNKFGKAWEEVSDVIKGMKKTLEDRDKQLAAVVAYNERTEERAVQRARAQLEQQLEEARQTGDVKAVEHFTKEKAKADFQSSHDLMQKQELERMQVEKDFREKNKHWININPVMTSRVEQIDAEEREKARSAGVPLTYTQLAKIIEARMRLEFPEVMLSPTAGDSAPTLSSARSAANKQAATGLGDIDKTFGKLNNEHLAVFKATNRMLERQGRKPYSKTEFVERLRKDGEI